MRVVFFTGSGLSADSGIPTFRGRGGLYSGMTAEEVLSSATFRTRPQDVHAFIDDFREMTYGKRPNAAHHMIAEWQREHPDETTVITMNVDTLLEQAGCQNVIHLHGVLTRLRSNSDSQITVDIGHRRYYSGEPGQEPSGVVDYQGELYKVEGYRFRCPVSGRFFRPDVVLFGESMGQSKDPYSYAPYYDALSSLGPDDALVVIGTQGNVVEVCRDSRRLECLKLLNNLHRSDPSYIREKAWDKVFRAQASEAAAGIRHSLIEWRDGK